MRPFEEAVAAELAGLLRAGVPPRGISITVREMLVMRLERGQLGPREVSEAVEAAVRGAYRLVHELGASDELAEIVCRSALEAVRGPEYHRYEGVSDPDDMAILYALETLSGLRGTLADAFGVYADPRVGAFMRAVALRTRR